VKKYIVLFRGINVGGKNLLPMKQLVSLLEKDGFEDVSFYIQSGNLVLKSIETPEEVIKTVVLNNFGFSPEVFILDETQFSNALSNNPYLSFEGKFVHFYFCHNSIKLNQEKMDQYLTGSEKYFINEKVFYLHAPDGIGRSKLVANIEKCLGQSATGRNLNTANKISAMLIKT
jgi:uncharacterized protein (DUF1697 family)